MASEFGVYASQVTSVEEAALGADPGIVRGQPREAVRRIVGRRAQTVRADRRLKLELEGPQKNLASSPEEKRRCGDIQHPDLSIVRQCGLLGLASTTYYCAPVGEMAENLALIRLIDEEYLRAPFYCSRKLGQSLSVNRKRVPF